MGLLLAALVAASGLATYTRPLAVSPRARPIISKAPPPDDEASAARRVPKEAVVMSSVPNPADGVRAAAEGASNAAEGIEAAFSKAGADAEAMLSKTAADTEAIISKTAADASAAAEASLVKAAADAEAMLISAAADAEAALGKTAEQAISSAAAVGDEALAKARAEAAKTQAEAEAMLTKAVTDAENMLKSTAEQALEAAAAVSDEALAKARADVQKAESILQQTAADAEAMLSKTAADAIETVSFAALDARATAEADATDKLARIAEVAASKTAAVSALSGGFLRRFPGALLARRTTEIWTFVAEITSKMSLAQRSGSRERKQAVSEDLCAGLLKLGPTFIKLGQILSTRYDILPYDYVKGLESLQDSVPAFDGELAYQIVCDEVGSDAFIEFNKEPIAAASLGQVHLATTRDGERVAVKVQRPALKELFDADLANLKVLAEILYKLDSSPDSMLRDWREIFESNARIIYEEIDYTKEAKNGRKFADNFASYDWVKVPEVRTKFSSQKVLTMEYVPGIKISDTKKIDAAGFSRADLARQSGEAFMIQLLRHGFFHCDPHPGNIAVDGNGPNGNARLVFYDFGMVDELSETFRRALVDGFFALYEGDAKQIVQALVDGEMLGGKVDRISTESIARYFLSSFRERLALDRATPMTPQERDEMRMATMQEVGNELAAVASDKPFRYPPALPYVLRAFNALEGVGKGLDPNYDVSRIANKYIKSLIDLRDGSAAITAIKKVQERFGWRRKDFASIVQSPRRVTEVYETLNKLETGELQLRVRALELERAMVRNAVMQRASLHAIAACCALNVGTVLSATGAARGLIVRAAWAAAIWFGVACGRGIRKLDQLQKGERDGNLNEYLLESKRQAG